MMHAIGKNVIIKVDKKPLSEVIDFVDSFRDINDGRQETLSGVVQSVGDKIPYYDLKPEDKVIFRNASFFKNNKLVQPDAVDDDLVCVDIEDILTIYELD